MQSSGLGPAVPVARRGAIEPAVQTRGVARRGVVLAVACIGSGMTFVDTTIVNIAFPSMHASFPGTPLSTLSWVFNGYNVVFAAFLVPAGRLCDRLGRRRLFELGLAGFAVASALCAAAPSAQLLIAARLLQAAGAAVLVPASLSLCLAAAPDGREARTFSVWASAAAVGAGVGTPLGGMLVRTSGWPLIFTVNLPVAVVALVLTRRLVVESRDASSGRFPDLLGATVLSLALGALALGLVKASDWGWTDARVIACWGAAATLLAVFAQRSARHPAPVFERAVLRQRGLVCANALTALGATGYFMYLLSNVLFFTGVWQYSALRAGVAVLPSAAVAAALARPAGCFADKHGHGLPILAGGALWGAGCLFWALRMGTHPAYLGGFLPGQLLTGAGVGLAFPVVGSAAVASVPTGRLGTAAGVNAAVRQIGAVLGIALAVSIVARPAPADPVGVFARVWEIAAVLFLIVAVLGALAMRTVHRRHEPGGGTSMTHIRIETATTAAANGATHEHDTASANHHPTRTNSSWFSTTARRFVPGAAPW